MSDNPFSFNGRIRRTEYCLSYIGCYAIQVALEYVLTDVEFGSIIYVLCLIPLVWFMLDRALRCRSSKMFEITPVTVLLYCLPLYRGRQ
jgi:uncharacterized membrane protein YhaH (DUF805 family)